MIVVTGFGPFAGVAENPTTELVRRLGDRQQRAESSTDGALDAVQPGTGPCAGRLLLRVMETSIEGAREAFAALEQALEGLPAPEVWLHLGVHGGATGLLLESAAYNEASFGEPDERGNKPMGAKIDPQGPPERSCGFDLDEVCSELRARVKGVRVAVSDDPGRFLCNYSYFTSLARHGSHVLFVHVPPFAVLGADKQLEAVDALLQILPAARLLDGSTFAELRRDRSTPVE